MIDISKGRYWDLPWSLVDGCTPCSPGCDHCWSAGMAHRFIRKVGPINAERMRGEPVLTDADGRFNGCILTRPKRLSVPLKRRKPTVYAVWNDLFHEAVPVNFLEETLTVVTNCPQHTFLVLTKRAQRLNLMTSDRLRISRTDTWPIKNLWLGITVCNQQEADEKIPVFLQVPGKKFLSIEPILGPVDLRDEHFQFGGTDPFWRLRHIDAVILGGETGPGARPMQIEWVRSIRDQCQSAGVPFFFKSFGKYPPFGNYRLLDGRTHDSLPWRKI